MRKLALLAGLCVLTSCGGPEEDKLRTVKSYDYSTCDSVPTSDATQLEAIKAFESHVDSKYFVRRRDSRFVANHESVPEASGVREYQGPFYIYVHPRQPDKKEAAQGVDWAATLFLHAQKVRSRANGQEWSDWQPVRTRNFSAEGRTVEGLGRWKCLLGAEITWATVTRSGGVWTVTPLPVSIYDQEEIHRALPVPTQSQIEGKQALN